MYFRRNDTNAYAEVNHIYWSGIKILLLTVRIEYVHTFNKLCSFNPGKKLEPSVLKNQNHGGSLSTYNSSDYLGSLNLLNFWKNNEHEYEHFSKIRKDFAYKMLSTVHTWAAILHSLHSASQTTKPHNLICLLHYRRKVETCMYSTIDCRTSRNLKNSSRI